MSAPWSLLWANAWDMLVHFTSLSLLAIGGVITVLPDLHRYVVDERAWLSPSQFGGAVALAQAAPGPNLLFIPLMGWHIGLSAPFAQAAVTNTPWLAWVLAVGFALLTLLAMLLPSSLLSYSATAWAQRNKNRLGVQAFKQGLAPVVVALLLSTAWLMATPYDSVAAGWAPALLSAACAYLVVRTRIHLLWLLAGGGALGAMGWI